MNKELGEGSSQGDPNSDCWCRARGRNWSNGATDLAYCSFVCIDVSVPPHPRFLTSLWEVVCLKVDFQALGFLSKYGVSRTETQWPEGSLRSSVSILTENLPSVILTETFQVNRDSNKMQCLRIRILFVKDAFKSEALRSQRGKVPFCWKRLFFFVMQICKSQPSGQTLSESREGCCLPHFQGRFGKALL